MKKQVYIIHGYRASSTNHWFPWLKKRLLADGVKADILNMPNPLQPRLEDWLDTLSLYQHTLHENTYLVAHSLGCPTILRFLEHLQLRKQLGGIILVSGFAKSLPTLQMLDEFTQGSFDHQKIIESAKHRAVIASKNDQIVPFSWSKELAQQIDAALYEVQHGGHFLENEGFTSLPIVYDILTSYFSKETR
ncbi:alpha/beta hydrolase [Bacillus subtilis]|uniref:alpha/beta hydrolase n=1 Tax=Bacillus subtilis TaxID=1423 RepID=UPI001F4D0C3B|nr:alpha/beta hydrolase [Bacillus subtilis]MCM3059818.1 alpha/beta hydrolase [Bacillus subtilis]MEC0262587.1 alpha/beta hydrolase [Bacillus subtilis]UNF70289.1 alpha/beta hydrolase [Bacillus subtilis]